MPGILKHSPANILRWLLIDLNLGTNPASGGSWPIFTESEPNTPDDCLSIYDTAGAQNGRTGPDGERQEHHGVQIRVRAGVAKAGFLKARTLALALDSTIYQDGIVVEGTSYQVQNTTRTSDVLPLGKEPTSKRSLFTINSLISVRQI